MWLSSTTNTRGRSTFGVCETVNHRHGLIFDGLSDGKIRLGSRLRIGYLGMADGETFCKEVSLELSFSSISSLCMHRWRTVPSF